MKFFTFLVIAAFTLAMVPMHASAQAIETIQRTVGVVQIIRLAKESKAGKSIAQQAKRLDEDFRKTLQAEEEKLKSAESQLVRQRTVLEPEAYGKKREEFQRQVAEMQEKVRERRQNIQIGLQQANTTLQTNIRDIIKEIAMTRKLMLVLPQEQVLFYENSLNITDEILQKLDAKLADVRISVSK